MAKVIEEIAVAANEGAQSTTNIAQKNAVLVEKSDEVMKQSGLEIHGINDLTSEL